MAGSRGRDRLAAVLGVVVLACTSLDARADGAGAEIHKARANWPGAVAGIDAGDVIRGYAFTGVGPKPLPGSTGRILEAVDLVGLEPELADLGVLDFSGESEGRTLEWHLPTGRWGLQARPRVEPPERGLVGAALAALERGDTDAGCKTLLDLAAGWDAPGHQADALWARWRCLNERIQKHKQDEALAQVAKLFTDEERSGAERRRLGLLALQLATSAVDSNEWKLLEPLLAFARASFPADDVLHRMLVEFRSAKSLVVRGQYPEAQAALEPLVAEARRLAPGTLQHAAIQNELAWVYVNRDRYEEAVKLLKECVDIVQARNPDSMDLTKYRGHYGMTLRELGEYDLAERQLELARDRIQAMEPDGLRIAATLNNLGVIRWDRGDLVGAEDAYLRALAIEEKRGAGSGQQSSIYGNLSYIAQARGDYELAEQRLGQARALIEKMLPGGTEAGQNAYALGLLAYNRERYDEAEPWFKKAIAVYDKIAPGSVRQAYAVEYLGRIAARRGQVDRARAQLQEALAIRAKAAPGSLDEAAGQWQVGEFELDQEQWTAARDALARAESIQARFAPDSSNHAHTLNGLGRALMALGEKEQARTALCQGADVLDRYREKVSRNPKEQADALALHARVRQDCIAALADAGLAVQAFDTLERGRGRALLAMLAQRDLSYAAQLPEGLRRELVGIESEASRFAKKRAALTGEDASQQAAQIAQQLRELDRRRAVAIARVRKEAPRHAALMFPEPLGYAALRARLPDDTAVVSIAIGRDDALAFVARKSRQVPSVRHLALERAQVQSDVAALRSAVLGTDPERARKATQEWHARLVQPLLADLDGITRLVIVPDAELFPLPFAALRDDQGKYLIERYSLVLSDSATLWSGMQSAPARGAAERGLVAVSNGEAGKAQKLPVRGATQDLPALPYARAEAEAVAALNPGKATVLSDAGATEPAVLKLAGDAGKLHFAVHSVFNPVTPLDSGLVLRPVTGSAEAATDGFLQAWEIFDGWRIQSELVTLSACDTGLGERVADEGLVGLTRAFQYAGAKNVVASLWSVSDRSTAELMIRFYRELARGEPADRALRNAQLSMLRGTALPDSTLATRGVGGLVATNSGSAQGYAESAWAAFQVYGGGR